MRVIAVAAALCFSTTSAAASCQEGHRCWSWSTMGNHKREVVDLSTDKRITVGPCGFSKLWMRGDARLWDKKDQMRGDWWAIQHGC